MPAHIYYTEDAIEFGLAESVLLQHIGFWCVTNLAKDQNIHDGNVWTYNPVKALIDLLPELCPPKDLGPDPTEKDVKKEIDRRSKIIVRHLDKLVKSGKLVTGNYNKERFDRTKWYAFSNPKDLERYGEMKPQALETLIGQKRQMDTTPPVSPIRRKRQMDLTKTSNGLDENVQAIPVIYKTDVDETKTTTTTATRAKIPIAEFVDNVEERMKSSDVPVWFIREKSAEIWERYKIPSEAMAMRYSHNDWHASDQLFELTT